MLFGKFNQHSVALDHLAWGPIYCGDTTNRKESKVEEKVRDQVTALAAISHLVCNTFMRTHGFVLLKANVHVVVCLPLRNKPLLFHC